MLVHYLIGPGSTPAIHLPARQKDQARLNQGISQAHLGLILGGAFVAGVVLDSISIPLLSIYLQH